ncbi:MAG: DUF2997 domain-containing protein [Planctomycetia bacterium]|nr:DUF2997 domain-containing protein [Planctomycetia bacterium]
MTTKTIEIIVDPKGQTRLETKGFAGSECREASRFVEQALGTRTDERITPEFHQQVTPEQVLLDRT